MFLLASLFASFALCAFSQCDCPPGDSPSSDGSKCFRFVNVAADFDAAQGQCANYGENLASVVNVTDEEIIFGGVQQRFSKAKYWIGGTNINKHMVWKWTNGKPSPTVVGQDTIHWKTSRCA